MEKNEAFKELLKIYKQAQIFKIHQLYSLEVIMVENLIKKNLLNFIVLMTLLLTFLPHVYLSQMMQLKERIAL